MAQTLTVRDDRTGKEYTLPIEDGALRATELSRIKTGPDDGGLVSYDPGFVNTASCKSKVTYIDGDRGILRYRGYPIEELAEKSTYLETAYLIVKGELPTTSHLAMWQHNIKMHTMVHESLKNFMQGFRYDAHPMGMLVGTVGALSTFYPDARDVMDLESRRVQTRRLIGKMPTIAAFAYRNSRGLPYVYPDNDLSYTGNFLSMLFKMTELKYKPNPVLEQALDLLFILHADHEQNCSSTAARVVGSALADPYSVVAAAAAALSGPRHGGANEEVVHMLRQIGSTKHIPELIKQVKAGERRLMGFGHRVYKNYDPRAKLMRETCYEVLEELGLHDDRIFKLAMALEKIALEDDYFVSRKLYPNVDFYSGIVQRALGIPVSMFTCIFSLARTVGWIAQWQEMISDPEYKIGRPRQLYNGSPLRQFLPLGKR
jgi:citrate synthase